MNGARLSVLCLDELLAPCSAEWGAILHDGCLGNSLLPHVAWKRQEVRVRLIRNPVSHLGVAPPISNEECCCSFRPRGGAILSAFFALERLPTKGYLLRMLEMGPQVSLAYCIANSIGWQPAPARVQIWALYAWTGRRSSARSAAMFLILGTDLLVSFILFVTACFLTLGDGGNWRSRARTS
jgi:hypothetical protein